MKRLLFVFWAVATTALGQANDKEIAYEQVVRQRAQKIVAALQLPDSAQFKRVSHRVAQQYLDLNILHEGVKTAKKTLTEPSEERTKQLETETNVRLGQLHKNYLADLAKELTPAQVDQIKDGMTYGVLPKTYRGYQEMLPDLTDTQKVQILTWLTEARELAMDADTLEKKHAWFGKYKGKINNYLSAQGIDMKKAGQDWEKRIKEAKNKS